MCYKIELPTEFKKRISTMLPEEELKAFLHVTMRRENTVYDTIL